MIRLVLVDAQNSAELVATEPVFRISGATIWVPKRITRGRPLVHYAGGVWHHDARQWSGMRFDGRCRLIFGLPRDPAGVSDELTGISIHGTTLTANGLPFAAYEADRDAWHGMGQRWWHAFRIEHVGSGSGNGVSKDSDPKDVEDSDPNRHLREPNERPGPVPNATVRHRSAVQLLRVERHSKSRW
jgi:hypothetical protein